MRPELGLPQSAGVMQSPRLQGDDAVPQAAGGYAAPPGCRGMMEVLTNRLVQGPQRGPNLEDV